ncbi:MAG TPA: MBG domain-containing protein [Gallionella sp.]|nr:MBG domain-containing protein [Gallionella sp.]
MPLSAFAANLPTGGQIVAGSGAISQSDTTLTVTQTTGRMAADWQSFSIGQGNTVNFVQPSASAVALNRVLGADVSVIQGALNANGQVFLVNPNGVLFTPTAQVNVGTLVASTLELSTDDFMTGNYRFNGNSSASVTNQGGIKAGTGGTVALIAARIENTGSITAPQGNVLLGAGSKVRLDLGGPVKIEVEVGALNTLIEQGGAIRADGGLVYLTAKAAGDLTSSAINHSGITEARSLATGEQGEIYLMGDMAHGTVNVSGMLDASPLPHAGEGPGERMGGFVETSAHNVNIADGTEVKADSWLIDPTNFTIRAGTDAKTTSGIGADTLAANLNTTSLKIETVAAGAENGDLHVNGAVTWSSANKLTLSAHGDININADITAQHALGKVQLEYGQGTTDGVIGGTAASYNFNGGKINLQAGDNFFTQLGSNVANAMTWKVITDLGTAGSISGIDMQGINGSLAGNYVLGADINASATSGWNSGAGFMPIGDNSNPFTGRFDGLGHIISNLTINRPMTTDYVGLFGHIQDTTLRHIGLVDADVTGNAYVGSLVGVLRALNGGMANVSNSYATGSVKGTDHIGGLVGHASAMGTINVGSSYAAGSVTGNIYVGGLVGSVNANNSSTINIANSYTTANVSGGTNIGGLVGESISNNSSAINIANSYATGAITGSVAGGLMGILRPNNAGGSTGASISINNSFWDMSTTGKDAGSGIGHSQSGGTINLTNVAGKTTVGMNQVATFTGWDSNIWSFGSGQTVPGYGVSRPYLGSVTRSADLPTETLLFGGGWGGLSSGQQAGADGSAYGIASWAQLANINHVANGDYSFELKTDLASNSAGYDAYASPTANGNAGWQPIGNTTTPFTGHFDGLGHTVTDLFINRPTTNHVGLFGYAENATLSNVGLVGGSMVGQTWVGGLMGGLEAINGTASISNSYVTGSVTGGDYVGGLAGYLKTSNNGIASISNSHIAGSVSGKDFVGAMVGGLEARDNPTSGTASIDNSYATGSVTGNNHIGGLAGYLYAGSNGIASIANSYAIGSVTSAGNNIGGLAGYLHADSGTASIGDSHWDIDTTSQTSGFGINTGGNFSATGLRSLTGTIDAYTQATYTGFNFSNTWFMVNGYTRPFLRMEHSTTITNAHQLQLMSMDLGASYTLANNIDLGPALTNSSDMWKCTAADCTSFQGSFAPVGNQTTRFTGSFDGLGHTISDLTINRPTTDYVGLFGYVQNATISNVGLVGGSVTGNYYVGGLAGRLDAFGGGTTSISNSYAAGNVTGDRFVGGLTGYLYTYNGTISISNSYASSSVSGDKYVGGLAGRLYADNGASISISNSYATGSVTGSFSGGLAGDVYAGPSSIVSISNSYATGNVTGNSFVGGLMGYFYANNATASISNSYATGSVTGSSAGGLAGGMYAYLGATASIDNSYATGSMTGSNDAGGLVGWLAADTNGTASISNSFWDIQTTGMDVSSGNEMQDSLTGGTITLTNVVGKTTAGMQTVSTYNSGGAMWDIAEDSGYSGSYFYPRLTMSGGSPLWLIKSAPIVTYAFTPLSDAYLYKGSDYLLADYWAASTLFGAPYSSWVLGTDYTLEYGGNTVTGFTDADTYSGIGINILKSGFNVADSGNTTGTFTITPAPLTITANGTNKTYDGTAYSGSNGITYIGIVDSESPGVLGGTLGFVGTSQGAVNAGSYVITPGGLTSGNYAITFEDGTLSIDPRPISVTADDLNKVYGNTDPALTYQVTAGNLVGSDSLSGALARAAGENVGSYSIDASALANGNYLITAIDGTLTIDPRPISVTADDLNKVYGDADPAMTYQVTSGNLVGSDSLGALTRAAGDNVGSYSIDASTLANGNYLITASNGTLTIDPRPISVTADDQSKTYGNADPALTYQVTTGNLVGSDSLGALTRAAGENVGGYTIDASALTNGNYLITAIDGTLTIDRRPISVTADNLNKTYGNADPALTYQVTSGNLVDSDSLSGALARAAGEDVNTYAINQGTVTGENNPNYQIAYTGANLTISAASTSGGTTDSGPSIQQLAITAAQQAAMRVQMQQQLQRQLLARQQAERAAAEARLLALQAKLQAKFQSTMDARQASSQRTSGGLVLMDVPAATPSGQSAGNSDPGGFMTVSVVNGGINMGDDDTGADNN